MEIKVLGSYQTQEDILEHARQSYNHTNESKGKAGDLRLLSYLIYNKHLSPFEHASITMQIKVPIFIARQFMRHRTFKYSETSFRLVEADLGFYIPDKICAQCDLNKQNSTRTEMEDSEVIKDVMTSACEEITKLYKQLVDNGVAKEQARMILPVNTYTTFTATMDLRNLLHFLHLRLGDGAQSEIQTLAKLMYDETKKIYPDIVELYDLFIIKSDLIPHGIFNKLWESNYVTNTNKRMSGEDQLLIDLGIKNPQTPEIKGMIYDAVLKEFNGLYASKPHVFIRYKNALMKIFDL